MAGAEATTGHRIGDSYDIGATRTLPLNGILIKPLRPMMDFCIRSRRRVCCQRLIPSAVPAALRKEDQRDD